MLKPFRKPIALPLNWVLLLAPWLLCIPPFGGSAQTVEIDSLRQLLTTPPPDTQYVNLLCDLSNAYRNVQIDSALITGHRALRLARKLKHSRGLSRAEYMLSAAHYVAGTLDSASAYIQTCIDRLSALHDEKRLIDAYNVQGIVFDQQNREPEALTALQQSLRLARKLGIRDRISTAYVSIGNIYYHQRNHRKALEYYHLAEPLLLEAGDSYTLGILYNNMGNMMEESFPDSVLFFLQKALTFFERGNYLDGVAHANNNLGDYYSDRGEWEPALRHFRNALHIWQDSNYPFGTANAGAAIGTVLSHLGNFSQAYIHLDQALAIAKKINDLELLHRIYQDYAEAFATEGRYSSAYEYQQLANETRDSLYKTETNQQLADQEADFKQRLHQEEILRLQERAERQQRINQITIAGAVGLLLLLAFGLWQYFRVRRQKEHVTMEKARVAKLQRLDQLKDQFLANTSHELRTPLNGIIGLAESLRDGAAGPLPVKVVTDLNMIAASGKRLSSLVSDILDFSQLKSRELSLRRRPVDLHAVADVVLRLSQPLLGTKAVQLINAIPPDTPLVDADENRLQQILHNLVGNAVKFTEKGYVKVGAIIDPDHSNERSEWSTSGLEPSLIQPEEGPSTRDDRLLTIFVEDTGIGIPVDRQVAIFQPFEQADGSTAREFGGTGLGLTVTKQLVELHGGTLGVRAEEGRGSTFTFTLPLSRPGQEAPPEAEGGEISRIRAEDLESAIADFPVSDTVVSPGADAPAATTDGEPVRILVVDDEPVNLQVLNNQLTLQGYQVVQAGSGMEALEILRATAAEGGPGRAFDLIILDIMMPRMSGYEVCARLREMFLPSELPVVMLTAKNRINDLVEGFNAGANDYLTKPFSKDELLSRIKTHLRLHRINRATGKFVPYEFLRAIGRETITEAKLGDMTERKVTMLFSDIREYTALSETMTPEENFKFVNAFHHRMGPVIRQHQGFINQYLGDAIMAIFPHQASDALRASVAMQHLLSSYNRQRTTQGRRPLRVGMGLHSGPLIMGIIGDEERLDAATIADTVNTASRIENLTKYFGTNILLTEDTLAGIKAAAAPASDRGKAQPQDLTDFHLRYLGPVLVKGKATPIGIYECFDGDPAELFDKKMATLPDFQQGLELYFAKTFTHAATAFQKVLDVNPDDDAARLFLNKAAHYITTGVPEGWTGVAVMEQK